MSNNSLIREMHFHSMTRWGIVLLLQILLIVEVGYLSKKNADRLQRIDALTVHYGQRVDALQMQVRYLRGLREISITTSTKPWR